jgi:hypothetical protein
LNLFIHKIYDSFMILYINLKTHYNKWDYFSCVAFWVNWPGVKMSLFKRTRKSSSTSSDPTDEGIEGMYIEFRVRNTLKIYFSDWFISSVIFALLKPADDLVHKVIKSQASWPPIASRCWFESWWKWSIHLHIILVLQYGEIGKILAVLVFHEAMHLYFKLLGRSFDLLFQLADWLWLW